MIARKRKTTKKAAVKRRRNTKAPSAKQLAARKRFALAAKARSKKAAKKRNTTVIKKARKVVVLNPNKKSRSLREITQPPGWRRGTVDYHNIEAIVRHWDSEARRLSAIARRLKRNKDPRAADFEHQSKFAKQTADIQRRHLKQANPKKTAKKRVTKKRNSSPTAIDNRKEFAGKYTGDLTLHFPQKSLTGLSTLGPLVSLQGEFGTIKPTKGGVYYCQDAKGRIHIGAKSDDDLWARVKENLGHVKRVEYRAAKPHLGYPQVITWYHDFEAPFPILKSDGQGGLAQVGGGYKIRREGIVG